MPAPASAPNPNKGYLFPNAKTKDSQPDYRGKVTINGQEWLLSAWKRDKDGNEMLTISVTDPASLPAPNAPNAPAGAARNPAPAGAPPSRAPAPAAPAGAPPAGDPTDIFGDIFNPLG